MSDTVRSNIQQARHTLALIAGDGVRTGKALVDGKLSPCVIVSEAAAARLITFLRERINAAARAENSREKMHQDASSTLSDVRKMIEGLEESFETVGEDIDALRDLVSES